VDFEKRIAEIYQRCRQPTEIRQAFDTLQAELSGEIDAAMTDARRKLLEHFDDDVRDRLKLRNEASRASLDRFEQMLMALTRHELTAGVDFDADGGGFTLEALPDAVTDSGAEVPLGRYELPRRSGDAHFYRLGHPLAQALVERARTRELSPATVEFDYGSRVAREGRIGVLAELVGHSGWLAVAHLSIGSLGQTEDHLLVAGMRDSGEPLLVECGRKLLGLPGRIAGSVVIHDDVDARLTADIMAAHVEAERTTSERNGAFFEAEAAKLDSWADDLKVGLERELKELDRQIKDARRQASAAVSLEAKVAGQKEVRALEARRNERRRSLFDEQDRIDRQRAELIASIEAKLAQSSTIERLFTIRWSVI